MHNTQQQLLESLLNNQEESLKLLNALQSESIHQHVVLPILTDLLVIYDHIASVSALFPDAPEDEHAVLSIYANQKKRAAEQGKVIHVLKQAILDFLYKHDVQRIEPPVQGSAFDPRFHRAMSFEIGRRDQDRTIQKVLRDGFQHHSKVLRPVDVTIFQSKRED